MADEYIKRSDAIDYIEDFVRINEYYHPHSKRTTIPIAEAIARINETPSADVAEVKRGKWLWDGYVYDAPYMCNCCSTLMDYESNYCPNCGARMEEWMVDDEVR